MGPKAVVSRRREKYQGLFGSFTGKIVLIPHASSIFCVALKFRFRKANRRTGNSIDGEKIRVKHAPGYATHAYGEPTRLGNPTGFQVALGRTSLPVSYQTNINNVVKSKTGTRRQWEASRKVPNWQDITRKCLRIPSFIRGMKLWEYKYGLVRVHLTLSNPATNTRTQSLNQRPFSYSVFPHYHALLDSIPLRPLF